MTTMKNPNHCPVAYATSLYLQEDGYEDFKIDRTNELKAECLRIHTIEDAMGWLDNAGEWGREITRAAMEGNATKTMALVKRCMEVYAELWANNQFEIEVMDMEESAERDRAEMMH